MDILYSPLYKVYKIYKINGSLYEPYFRRKKYGKGKTDHVLKARSYK